MSVSVDLITQDAMRYAVPLWLAGLGELVSERGGVVNIGIEGMMLTGAMAAWAATVATGSPWLGLLAAACAAAILAGLFAVVTLVFHADQVVAGTALNLLAMGATGTAYKWCLHAGWTQRQAHFFEPVVWTALPFTALNQFGLCYATLGLAIALYLLLRYTRWGIELIALGEYPIAAAAAGIRVNLRRAACVLFGGATAGLAGSYLSIMFTHQFNENITAGRGFLALAMVIFGRWKPGGLIVGGLFFGAVYAVQILLEVSRLHGLPAAQILQMAPYVLTLIVLAGLMGKSRAPAALGQSFESE